MNEIDNLLHEYERFVRLPWDRALAGGQKVWFVIYDPSQERRLRLRIPEFELVTKDANHNWKVLDITDSFAQWMAQHEYRDAYFEDPEAMDLALEDYAQHVADMVTSALTESDADDNTVVALAGVASLFGLTRASKLLKDIEASIRGRLLVFFPGHHDGSNYRLLDARDGWNYLAIAITAAGRA